MATAAPQRLPGMAYLCIICGMIINLHLGCLYAFSIWRSTFYKMKMISDGGLTLIYVLFCFLFALAMILGGWLTDRIGARITAIVGGAVMGLGLLITGACLNLAPFGVMLAGFGIIASLGTGLAFSATVTGALKWRGTHLAGLVAGLVMFTYGFSAIIVAPLVNALVQGVGLRASFIILGLYYGLLVMVAGVGLVPPPPGYTPPGRPLRDAGVGEALGSPHFYLMFFMFMFGVAAGVAFIGQMWGVIGKSLRGMGGMVFAIPMIGGLLNGFSRPVTGVISDFTGRHWPLIILYGGAAISAFLVAILAKSGAIALLVFIFSASYLFYGSLFSLFPALTVDRFGTKNLGTIYGLIFFGGFGLGTLLVQGIIRMAGPDTASRYPFIFIVTGVLALLGVGLAIVSLVLTPKKEAVLVEETGPYTPAPASIGRGSFCSKCGSPNVAAAIFCQECGSPLKPRP
jgi:OFA family oxalate/formate antiporter-like MFS transporter